MKLIDLCLYTKMQIISDDGTYPPFKSASDYSAEEIVMDVNK